MVHPNHGLEKDWPYQCSACERPVLERKYAPTCRCTKNKYQKKPWHGREEVVTWWLSVA